MGAASFEPQAGADTSAKMKISYGIMLLLAIVYAQDATFDGIVPEGENNAIAMFEDLSHDQEVGSARHGSDLLGTDQDVLKRNTATGNGWSIKGLNNFVKDVDQNKGSTPGVTHPVPTARAGPKKTLVHRKAPGAAEGRRPTTTGGAHQPKTVKKAKKKASKKKKKAKKQAKKKAKKAKKKVKKLLKKAEKAHGDKKKQLKKKAHKEKKKAKKAMKKAKKVKKKANKHAKQKVKKAKKAKHKTERKIGMKVGKKSKTK